MAEHRPVEGSIEIVREKQAADDIVIAVQFEDTSGRSRRAMLGFYAHDNSWHQHGGFAGNAMVRDRDIWETWGGWGPASSTSARAVVGGWVAEPQAATIRVTDPSGRVVEDAVQDGVAILMWLGAFNYLSGTAELLDADGRVLRTGPMRADPVPT